MIVTLYQRHRAKERRRHSHEEGIFSKKEGKHDLEGASFLEAKEDIEKTIRSYNEDLPTQPSNTKLLWSFDILCQNQEK